MARLSTEWMGSLAMRENLLRNDIPHVPVLVEDIPKYVSLADYEENCVKRIQTVGEIVPKSGRAATVLTLTPENCATFPISLKNLPINYLYVRNKDASYSMIWEKNNVFKLFGSLQKCGSDAALEVDYLVPVQDPIGSWQTLKILSLMARCETRQYCRSSTQNDLLELQWEKMKVQKKRLVKVQV